MMKAKEGMKVLSNFTLLKKNWASPARLYGPVDFEDTGPTISEALGQAENNPFVLPVFKMFSFVLKGSTKMAICLAAVILLFGGFCVPTIAGPTLDLTTPGSSGNIGLAYFEQADPQATGTGLIQSFVRLKTNQEVEQGYNTDARPLQFDENNSPQFTRSLMLNDVPEVDIGGTLYREFLLDINQKKSDGLLSLDELEIYLANSGGLTGYNSADPGTLGTMGTLIYDLDAGVLDNWILLDYNLNPGSGSGDMFAYIPSSLFDSGSYGSYVYLYSKFGQSEDYGNNDGFEEWAVRICQPPVQVIPTPGAIVLGSIGIGIVGWLRRRKTL